MNGNARRGGGGQAAPPPEFNQAMERAKKDDFAGALLLFRKAMMRRAQADTASNIGFCLRRLGRDEEAVKAYGQALTINPGHTDALANLAALQIARGEFTQTVDILQRADAIVSRSATLLVNRFVALYCLARFDEAEAEGRRALALEPNLLTARKNLADLLLLTGHMPEGFRIFEDRVTTKDFDIGNRRPRWQGENLQGKTLLAVTEQGYGDTFLFLRYGGLVRRAGGRILLVCRKELRRLLQNCPVLDALANEGEAVPEFDYHVSLLSLPHMFSTTLENIPAGEPYILADPAVTVTWKTRIDAAAGSSLKVGISWAGSTSFWDDRRRSPGLSIVEPLFSTPGVHFFLLQMGAGRAALNGWTPPANVTDLGAELTDFADTAGIMANLDVVISSCTSTAHLAGALGRPLWVMLHPVPYWVWMLNRSDNPWYPTARLFRQSTLGSWDNVIDEVRGGLKILAGKDHDRDVK